MDQLPGFEELGLAGAIILVSLVLGWVFERVAVGRLKRWVAQTSWQGDEIFIKSLRGNVILLSLVGGLYAALAVIQLLPKHDAIADRILLGAFVLVLTVILGRVTVGFVEHYAANIPGVQPSTSIFAHMARLFVYVIGALVFLQTLGISITPMLTALGVGGLGVALALQDTLSNLFSGLHLIASKQVRVGEYIRLTSGEEGYVDDITWRNTTLRGIRDNMVIVPNSSLATTILTNFNQPEKQMSVVVDVGVAYDSDLTKVERVTREVATSVMAEIAGGISDYEPRVRYHSFGDSSIDFSVVLRVAEFSDQYLIKHEFIKRLHERYKEELIEIPFPIQTVLLSKAES